MCLLRQISAPLLLICLCLTCTVVRAEDDLLTDDELYDEEYCPRDERDLLEKLRPEQTPLTFLDTHQETVSAYLRSLTNDIDTFFADTEKYDENTGSFMRLVLDTTFREAGRSEFDPGLKFRLRLPQTQKKLKLVIESDPEEKQNTRELETRTVQPINNENQNTGVYTGLETEVAKKSKWSVRPSLGLRIRSPIDYYVRLRISRDKFYDKWKVYLNETVYWFESTGFGADTTMEWDRFITKELVFRSSSFLRYTDERDQFDMSQSLNLLHQLSSKRSIAYKIAVFADSEPSIYTTSYLLNIRYRQNLHKDYLFYEIQPSVIYERETDWDPQYELFLRLELFYRG